MSVIMPVRWWIVSSCILYGIYAQDTTVDAENSCETQAFQCASNSYCVDGRDSWFCPCNDGYYREDPDANTSCLKVTPCDETSCGTNANCVQTADSSICECDYGFAGDPELGCMDVSYCQYVECGVNALCREAASGYYCTCKEGYQGNPTQICTDINECTSYDTLYGVCGCGQTCSNTDPGATCTDICVDSCSMKEDGLYKSCYISCDRYVQCEGGSLTTLPCRDGLVWDDIKKACVWESNTCSNQSLQYYEDGNVVLILYLGAPFKQIYTDTDTDLEMRSLQEHLLRQMKEKLELPYYLYEAVTLRSIFCAGKTSIGASFEIIPRQSAVESDDMVLIKEHISSRLKLSTDIYGETSSTEVFNVDPETPRAAILEAYMTLKGLDTLPRPVSFSDIERDTCVLYTSSGACQNGGGCTGTGGNPVCSCEIGFYGNYCEQSYMVILIPAICVVLLLILLIVCLCWVSTRYDKTKKPTEKARLAQKVSSVYRPPMAAHHTKVGPHIVTNYYASPMPPFFPMPPPAILPAAVPMIMSPTGIDTRKQREAVLHRQMLHPALNYDEMYSPHYTQSYANSMYR